MGLADIDRRDVPRQQVSTPRLELRLDAVNAEAPP